MRKHVNLTILKIAVPVLIFVFGICLGIYVHNKSDCNNVVYKLTITKYSACAYGKVINKKGYTAFKSQLDDMLNKSKADGVISGTSVYFRDLNNGPTFGIREHENFSPASLLKLPMLIAYLDQDDERPGFLDTTIGFGQMEDDYDQHYPAKMSPSPNTPYTIHELLSYMIKYSDNRSYYALRQYLLQVDPPKDLLAQTYVDLGIVDPQTVGDQTISVKAYGSIFVQLFYNSFFSNEIESERALELLSDTDFKDGLVRGLPVDVVVAHKFGERSNLPGNEKQLHDCGIIYYPKNPYLLCVMTRGKNFEDLSKTIGLISQMVYKEIDSRKL